MIAWRKHSEKREGWPGQRDQKKREGLHGQRTQKLESSALTSIFTGQIVSSKCSKNYWNWGSLQTSSKASKMSMLGWCIVQTTVLPLSTVFRTVRMTIAAARASSPDVGLSMNIIEGLATSSTAIVSHFLCSVDSPVLPGSPTKAFLKVVSSTRSITSFTKVYKKNSIQWVQKLLKVCISQVQPCNILWLCLHKLICKIELEYTSLGIVISGKQTWNLHKSYVLSCPINFLWEPQPGGIS